MTTADKFLEENMDTSYDASFKAGFAEALKIKFGQHKEPNIIHYPWVGADYKRQSTKILIILESAYLSRNKADCSITGGVASLCREDYIRRIRKEAAVLGKDGGYYCPTHRVLNELLTGHKYEDTARRDLWRALASYNFVTCPLDWSGDIIKPKRMSEAEFLRRKDEIVKSSKDGYNNLKKHFPDFIERKEDTTREEIANSKDIAVFKTVVGILQPNVCIIAASKVRDAVGGQIREICRGINATSIFTPHPSWRRFVDKTVMQEERNKLPIDLRNLLSIHKK